jgi:O-methyltransferase
MEPRFGSTVDGNLLSRANLLQFIRTFVRSSEIEPGYVLEFGVLNGSSIVELWGILRGLITHIYGFDTFSGLPDLTEDDSDSLLLMPQFRAGNFASLDCDAVKRYVLAATSGLGEEDLTLIPGLFSDTLPRFETTKFSARGPCLVAHVDCDLYSSSREVFKFLDGVCTTGTWLLLDDYWTYRGSPNVGQRRAFQEWMAASSRLGVTEYGNYNGFCKAFIIYER